MDADELFDHALSSLPEAVGDLLRDGKDPREFVFAGFDGASQLGRAFIATDLAVERGEDSEASRAEVQRMLVEAEQQGEGHRLLHVAVRQRDEAPRGWTAPRATRLAVGLWLDAPLHQGHFRVVALAGEQVRAATVDASVSGAAKTDQEPISSSMLN